MKDGILEKYLAAGNLAATILRESAQQIRVGGSYLELVESVEARVKDEGADLAFPLNVSLNEDAAHDTASTGDERIFGKRRCGQARSRGADRWLHCGYRHNSRPGKERAPP